jgi:predicted dehydrogenase
MMKHKVGVAGLRQAAGFINIFESYQGTKVTAICDINEALLNEVGEHYGIEQRFTDYEAFVQTDIDMVFTVAQNL